MNTVFLVSIALNVIVWGTLIVSFSYFTIRRKIAEFRSKKAVKTERNGKSGD